jgi:uncharacterized lipoprotein YmbA
MLFGCRGSIPKTEFYTLNSISNAPMDAQPISAGQPLSIGVGPVTIPEVLDRPQIVIRTSPNKLQIDEFHRWAGRLEKDFARVLAENISLMLATEQVGVYPWDASFKPRYQVILDVQRFEGRFNQKDVLLEVFWKVIDPQKKITLVAKKSAIKESLTAMNYETLVATKSRVVAELSSLIILEINNLYIKLKSEY